VKVNGTITFIDEVIHKPLVIQFARSVTALFVH
jgi:hypothetical protein